MHTEEYIYDIGERVVITPLNVVGFVDAVLTDVGGDQYKVIYWNDGSRYTLWLYACEITEFKEKSPIGIKEQE